MAKNKQRKSSKNNRVSPPRPISSRPSRKAKVNVKYRDDDFSIKSAKSAKPAKSQENKEKSDVSFKWSLLSSKEKDRQLQMLQQWLEKEYEKDATSMIPRSSVYSHHILSCQQQDIVPCPDSLFGKTFHSTFPNVAQRRIGTRGNSRYQYAGLNIRKESSFYDTISRDKVECLTPKPKNNRITNGPSARENLKRKKRFHPIAKVSPQRKRPRKRASREEDRQCSFMDVLDMVPADSTDNDYTDNIMDTTDLEITCEADTQVNNNLPEINDDSPKTADKSDDSKRTKTNCVIGTIIISPVNDGSGDNTSDKASKKKNSNDNKEILCTWMRENYIVDPTSTLRRSVVYEHYEDYCRKNDHQVCPNSVFGKAMREVFPSVCTRRLGQRGESVYHYGGLNIKAESDHYDTVSKSIISTWAPRPKNNRVMNGPPRKEEDTD